MSDATAAEAMVVAERAVTTANDALAAIRRHEAICDERQRLIMLKLDTGAANSERIEGAVKAVHKRLDTAADNKNSLERRVLLAALGLLGAALVYYVARYGVTPVQH